MKQAETTFFSKSQQNFNSFFELMFLSDKLQKANPLLKNKPSKMDISSNDVQQLLKSFEKYRLKYLLIGGMAGAFYGHNRTTADMDIWVKNSPENREGLVKALQENLVAGADNLLKTQFVFGYTSVSFGKKGFVLDLGDRTKVFTQNDFDACYSQAITGNFEGVSIKVILLADLIKEKKATGRPKDLGDLIELEKLQSILFPEK